MTCKRPILVDTSHLNAATEYALLANCLQFRKEASINPGNSGTNATRAMICELIAIKMLREYNTRQLIDALYNHACQAKYVVSIPWENAGDVILWDNTCVMHRSTGGSFEGKHKRDMRRATVHDASIHAWGLNERSGERMGYP